MWENLKKKIETRISLYIRVSDQSYIDEIDELTWVLREMQKEEQQMADDLQQEELKRGKK